MDDTGGGRRFVCGDVAGDEMMIGVGNFRYVYVRDEAVIIKLTTPTLKSEGGKPVSNQRDMCTA